MNGILGVPEEIAEDDACKVEHLVSDMTVNRILGLVKFIESNSKANSKFKNFVEEFQKHLQTNGDGTNN